MPREREAQQVREITAFFQGKDDQFLKTLLEKYDGELDAELREDEIKCLYYLILRESGSAPVWAAMSACRRGARQRNSEGSFLEHAQARMRNMTPYMQNLILNRAKKAGINTHGKVHMPGIGAADDPKAWVTGTDDILRVCKERNLTCEGHVTHQGQEVPPKQVALADDLVDEMVNLEHKVNPKTRTMDINRLRGLVKEKYGQQKSRLKVVT
jgi:hypothetical protein